MTLKLRFSFALFHARTRKGLTQAQVAEGVNISVRWYQIIEKGTRLPSALLTLKLIEYLDIDGKDLRKEV